MFEDKEGKGRRERGCHTDMDLLKAVLTSPSPVSSLVGSAMLHCGEEEAKEKECNVCVPYKSLNERRISVKIICESIPTR